MWCGYSCWWWRWQWTFNLETMWYNYYFYFSIVFSSKKKFKENKIKRKKALLFIHFHLCYLSLLLLLLVFHIMWSVTYIYERFFFYKCLFSKFRFIHWAKEWKHSHKNIDAFTMDRMKYNNNHKKIDINEIEKWCMHIGRCTFNTDYSSYWV